MRLFLLILAILALAPCARAASPFPRSPLPPLQSGKLFDLGVTDFDRDGRLDLFTVNHKFDASLLLNASDGWRDAYEEVGLSPTPAFPGLESVRSTPRMSAPGIYLFASVRERPGDPFHLRSVGRVASGSISFAARDVRVETVSGAAASVRRNADGGGTVDFELAPGGSIDLAVDHHDLPVTVRFDPPIAAGEIHVGADAILAGSRYFELRLRDRHGYGFADFDGDLRTDVLITAGGLGGEILDPFYVGRQSDELLLDRAGRLVDHTFGSGLLKGACRGRGVDVADLDGDGILDLLIECEGAAPQIALGHGDGRFSPAAAPTEPGDAYRLLDVRGDRRPEILDVAGSELRVWSLRASEWVVAQRIRLLNRGGSVTHLALGDVDADNRLDALAISPRGSTLLLNRDRRLLRRDPGRRLRIPTRGSVAGAFVDYDNDGDFDLHLLPRGLLERRGGRYRRTGLLRYGRLPAGRVRSGTVSWADIDGDGRRDPISARGAGEMAHGQVLDLRRNRVRSGSWLQLELLGPPGNAEATGAKVRVRAAGRVQSGWPGASDDSRASSGHRRIYFGLGRARRVERLTVRWQDGRRTVRRGLRVDRILRIAHPDRRP